MGTQHLTAVFVDNQYKVAQHGQWNGFPSGQGLTVLRFLRDSMDKYLFTEKVRAAKWIQPEKLDALWNSYRTDYSDLNSYGRLIKFGEDYPQFSRNTGAAILEYIQKSPDGILLSNDIEFANGALRCAWVWVVDFDKNTFEGYINRTHYVMPEDTRFSPARYKGRYHYLQMAASFSLDALPPDDEFLSVLACEDDGDTDN